MFKIFTAHPASRGKNYFTHAWLATKIGVRLSLSSACFLAHALLPIIKIPDYLNLESTALYLFERNNDLEN